MHVTSHTNHTPEGATVTGAPVAGANVGKAIVDSAACKQQTKRTHKMIDQCK